jgi:hypothetical protein
VPHRGSIPRGAEGPASWWQPRIPFSSEVDDKPKSTEGEPSD